MMQRIKFEYRITAAYLLTGGLWIIFSDRLLNAFAEDTQFLTEIQTYKGWFYVSVTAILFFLFLKKYLKRLRHTESELENHRDNLQQLVHEKTHDLDQAVSDLHGKNIIINEQNQELKKTIKNLKETQAQLMQAEKMASLGILTSGIAHEINNPLNYISGGLTGIKNILAEKKVKDDKSGLFVESIQQGVDRVSAIVSGLTNFSRDTDRYDERCDLHQIIENCLTIINGQLISKISIVKNFSNQVLIIPGNSGQLHQVFINILKNARQSIKNEGSITIATRHEDHNALVEITDTGCGIDQHDLPRITDPFYTTKDPGEGTGLGLSITYNIIRQHQGKLMIESMAKKGTVVRISLPDKTARNE